MCNSLYERIEPCIYNDTYLFRCIPAGRGNLHMQISCVYIFHGISICFIFNDRRGSKMKKNKNKKWSNFVLFFSFSHTPRFML